MSLRVALVGNPNSGKTTLFNRLTGTHQKTGNWPGVTVEKKTGVLHHKTGSIILVDLPGIYSLSPYSLEETITRNYIVYEKPDLVINIIDATNLERNLYLTLQLKKLGRPMIVALNMMDELLGHGDQLDVERLSELLEVPVIPISAKKGDGIDELLNAIFYLASCHHLRVDDGFHRSHHRHRHQRRHHKRGRHFDPDQTVQADFDVEQSEGHEASALFTFAPETEAETVALCKKAAWIHDQVLKHSHKPGTPTRSDRIDRILTHRIWAFPIFFLILFFIFQITFHESIGGRLTTALESFFSVTVSGLLMDWLQAAAAPSWIESLIIDGVLAGVGGVLSFLPQIALLFFFLSILEDTGYMARAAFITDKLFQKLGLTGHSFIPMMMGFGCTVPAVMAARTLESEKDRKLTILMTPFMSCGARMPIYAFLAGIFFSAQKGLITFSMYLLGILVAVASAFLFSRTLLKGDDSLFIIELPPYRIPDVKSLLMHVWIKVKDFMVRAGTLIFAMTVLVWFLQSFSFTLRQVSDSADSMFGQIGALLAPLFRPLGFGSWQICVALLTGLVAKESVVATMEILFSPGQLQAAITPLAAYALMTFTLLYTPCMAAMMAIRREMNSWKWTLISVLYQTGIAWLVSFMVYQVGRLLCLTFGI